MPTIKSSKKRLRQERKRRLHNAGIRANLRTALKKVHQAEDKESAAAYLVEAYAKLDKAAKRGLIHPNKAARRKSRLTKWVNQLKD